MLRDFSSELKRKNDLAEAVMRDLKEKKARMVVLESDIVPEKIKDQVRAMETKKALAFFGIDFDIDHHEKEQNSEGS